MSSDWRKIIHECIVTEVERMSKGAYMIKYAHPDNSIHDLAIYNVLGKDIYEEILLANREHMKFFQFMLVEEDD